MSDDPIPPGARIVIRIYLSIAVIGAVLSLPALGLIAWYAWGFTRHEWPGNWLGWVFFALFSLIMIGGPIVGWVLYLRGRPILALAVSAFSFLFVPLTVAGMVLGA